MALNATIHKCRLQVSDLDRGYYGSHELTIARHPSETVERMMVRLLVFALHADERLCFTRGISSDDEPDLWRRSLSDEIELWIELGQPDEKRIRRACGRADEVLIYGYQQRAATAWWEQERDRLGRFGNLSVRYLTDAHVAALAQIAGRGMDLQCTVQDGEVWLSDPGRTIQLRPGRWR